MAALHIPVVQPWCSLPLCASTIEGSRMTAYLVPVHLLSGIGVAGFRNCLHRDVALTERLHEVLHSEDGGEFVDHF
ncbi:hypothetical protein AURDEDRAFT_169831 [Auricularia subglabra TFB-10046 SS5]|nr:hypothetical protein AURDEDRAFT_169831 [Auricularia subglabra TFB-10046 SS5]